MKIQRIEIGATKRSAAIKGTAKLVLSFSLFAPSFGIEYAAAQQSSPTPTPAPNASVIRAPENKTVTSTAPIITKPAGESPKSTAEIISDPSQVAKKPSGNSSGSSLPPAATAEKRQPESGEIITAPKGTATKPASGDIITAPAQAAPPANAITAPDNT